MPAVRVLPDDRALNVDQGQDLLSALRASGFPIEGVCNGKGTCGKCLVRVTSGSVSEPTGREREWQLLVGKGMRLACQTKVLTNVTVLLPETSRTSEAKILMAGRVVEAKLSPMVEIKGFEVSPPSLSDQRPDVERVLEQVGVDAYDPKLLAHVPKILRDSNWRAQAVVVGERLVDVMPDGVRHRALGVAADIGTTTIVVYLYDIASGQILSVKADYNGQIKYGEDVVTRMSYAMGSEEGLSKLQEAVVGTLNSLIGSAVTEVGASVDEVYDLVVAGNSVMTSFLVGADPSAIAKAPYTPPFLDSVRVKGRELGLSINQAGILRSLPLISGYVGGDVVGDVLVSGMYRSESLSLLIDLGTNGEVVIGSSMGMTTASCAAGPALEGYGITRGMRAMNGAIESVAMDRDTWELFYRTVGGAKPRGICGSGVVDSVAAMLAAGLLDPSGRMSTGSSNRVVRHGRETSFVVAKGEESADGKDIVLTQGDIRRFQLAKAAIYAATHILMSRAQVSVDRIEHLYVAGAFGNYISPVNAMLVGLLPEVPLERVIQIGNGSGMGACALLKDKGMWREAELVSHMTKPVELNLVSGFQKEYVEATFLPHKSPELFPRSRAAVRSMAKAGP